ncbi:MAG: sigma-70 family RNA polymerase sigma factor [Eubacteriales bacterium]|nr:sigma-70 family RNA polymerase sigma factor [Eubacteriales bacterium]
MVQLLAKKAVKGDTDAFLELMERNSLSMYKVARGILNNEEDAADAVQDTILHCFEKIHTLKKPEYFKTWMIRILINECNQILRMNRREALPGELPDEACRDGALEEFEFREMLNLVEERYRLVLILYYVEGFKVQEIADLLDMKENTVKTRLARAREQIRAEYGKGLENGSGSPKAYNGFINSAGRTASSSFRVQRDISDGRTKQYEGSL